MKKLLLVTMALVMTLSFVGCGGDSSSKEPEFTEEQQLLAQEFVEMSEEFNKTVDKVNASPELSGDENVVNSINELTAEIDKLDEVFSDPEALTPEVMESITLAIDAVYEFIDAVDLALEAIEGAKAS